MPDLSGQDRDSIGYSYYYYFLLLSIYLITINNIHHYIWDGKANKKKNYYLYRLYKAYFFYLNLYNCCNVFMSSKMLCPATRLGLFLNSFCAWCEVVDKGFVCSLQRINHSALGFPLCLASFSSTRARVHVCVCPCRPTYILYE